MHVRDKVKVMVPMILPFPPLTSLKIRVQRDIGAAPEATTRTTIPTPAVEFHLLAPEFSHGERPGEG
jgi:hypothetical protein